MKLSNGHKAARGIRCNRGTILRSALAQLRFAFIPSNPVYCNHECQSHVFEQSSWLQLHSPTLGGEHLIYPYPTPIFGYSSLGVDLGNFSGTAHQQGTNHDQVGHVDYVPLQRGFWFSPQCPEVFECDNECRQGQPCNQ